jgi:hypothetical protein
MCHGGSRVCNVFCQFEASLSQRDDAHSIVLSDHNALIYQHKIFLHTMKHRHPSPSEICALEFKGEFRRFGFGSISTTIGIDWSILRWLPRRQLHRIDREKTVSVDHDDLT